MAFWSQSVESGVAVVPMAARSARLLLLCIFDPLSDLGMLAMASISAI